MPKDKKENQDIEKISNDRDEYLDGWKRAKADLINYKKDEFKRLEEVARFSNQQIVMDLIKVVDSFELAVSVIEKEGSAEKGIYMIKSQLMDVLSKYGVEVIEVNVGDVFDPNIHEAITTVETDEAKDDQVAEEVERGYTMGGRVLRATRVKVYKQTNK